MTMIFFGEDMFLKYYVNFTANTFIKYYLDFVVFNAYKKTESVLSKEHSDGT